MYIEIKEPPQGKAPLWVREAWVGLTIPLHSPDIVTAPTRAVAPLGASFLEKIATALAGKTETTTGYVVPSRTAIEILAAGNTQAAKWWVDNVPQALNDGQTFMFNTQACRRL